LKGKERCVWTVAAEMGGVGMEGIGVEKANGTTGGEAVAQV
jgi:hypothetical protein